ncbi:hypothetical protein E4U59_004021 [Claviceps monticola]|nr:hypothetical protein E4U59_004021 [Claviceps monticola]
MTSSQDEFLSTEKIALTTQHAIASELPQAIHRFDKEISSEWKSGHGDPDLASPQDATDWMANRIRAYTVNAPTLERFREDFKGRSLSLFTEANAGVHLCLRDLLQKKGIETKKRSGDSVSKILFEIVKFGTADPMFPPSPAPVQALPTRPTTPTHPVNETQPIQIMQQTLQQLMQQQTETQQMQQAAMCILLPPDLFFKDPQGSERYVHGRSTKETECRRPVQGILSVCRG